jgi:cytoskeletal protein CcmA (bactofilin family)
MNDTKKTLVEEGTLFKGSLSSKCPIEVKGRIEGDLTAPSLDVSAEGAVHGKVKVETLLSQGELAGEFDADVVRLSGVVKDNTVIRAKSLEVKLAPANGKMQVTFGECALEVGDAPTRDASTTKDEPKLETKGRERDKADKNDKSERKDKVELPSVPPPGGN